MHPSRACHCLQVRQHVVALRGPIDLPADARHAGTGVGGAHRVFALDLVAPVVVARAAFVARLMRAVGLVMEHHRRAGEDEGQPPRGGKGGQACRPRRGAHRQVCDGVGLHGVEPVRAGRRVVRWQRGAVPSQHLVTGRARRGGQVRGQRAAPSRDQQFHAPSVAKLQPPRRPGHAPLPALPRSLLESSVIKLQTIAGTRGRSRIRVSQTAGRCGGHQRTLGLAGRGARAADAGAQPGRQRLRHHQRLHRRLPRAGEAARAARRGLRHRHRRHRR